MKKFGYIFSVIIIVIAMFWIGYFSYNINIEKNKLKEQIESLESKISELEYEIEINKNNTESNVNNNNIDLEKLEEENTKVIDKYLNLWGMAAGSPESLLIELNLTTREKIEECRKNEIIDISDDMHYIKTNVKYEDLKNEMLKYQTESLFKKDIEGNESYKKVDDYIAIINGGGSGINYEIREIKLLSIKENIYTYNVYYSTEESEGEREHIKITMEYSNGKYLVSNIEYYE